MSGLLLALVMGGVAVLIPTAYAGYIGAPWAPTRIRAVRKAFNQLEVSASDTVIDLGAGDGKILLEASRRGANAVGYELSPIMWTVAWLRSLFHRNISIRWKNFYKQPLPAETTVIFVFLMPENMSRVRAYLKQQHLPHVRAVVSYAFPFKHIPPRTSIKEPNCATMYFYKPSELI